MVRSLRLTSHADNGRKRSWLFYPLIAGAVAFALFWIVKRLGLVPALGGEGESARERWTPGGGPYPPRAKSNPLLEQPAAYGAKTATTPETSRPADPIEKLNETTGEQSPPIADILESFDDSALAETARGDPASSFHLVSDDSGAEEGLTAGAPSPGWVEPRDGSECPPEFPIKGKSNSHIYHLPGQASYAATIPEICFANEEIAAELGYRPRKR